MQMALLIEEVSISTAAVVASQSLGGAAFHSVGNTLLQNYLLDANQGKLIPEVNIRVVSAAGATAFRDLVPASPLLDLYDDALHKVFVEAIPMAGLAFVAILGVEWKTHR
jgi:hypothetical protein